jgi:hypothetical protein
MMLAALLLACEQDPVVIDPGFEVIGSSPEDGADDVVEAHLPEVRFNEVTDPDLCHEGTVRLDALNDDDTVAFAIPSDLERIDDGVKLRFMPLDPLPTGWRIAMTVRDGSGGCADLSGDVVRPFRAIFFVP